jgi:hypothetical protein
MIFPSIEYNPTQNFFSKSFGRCGRTLSGLSTADAIYTSFMFCDSAIEWPSHSKVTAKGKSA